MSWPKAGVEVSESAARDAGLVCLSGPYKQREMWMAHAVLRDLHAGCIAAVLVRVDRGVEVWRSRDGMRIRTKEK